MYREIQSRIDHSEEKSDRTEMSIKIVGMLGMNHRRRANQDKANRQKSFQEHLKIPSLCL
jgi:hypothetical protein